MRLSAKQKDFLQTLADYPIWPGQEFPVICIHNIPERIWFTFRTENQVYAWVGRLEARGFVKIEKEHFARLTAKGREAAKD